MKFIVALLMIVFMAGCNTNRTNSPQVGIFKEDNENQTFQNAPRIINGIYIEKWDGGYQATRNKK